MDSPITPRTPLASNVAPKPMSRVCGLEPTTDNGVRCLELKVFQYRPVRVLCTDAASIKVLASVGISYSNRFCLDGVELKDRVIHDVEWLIRYHRDSEGHLHIDNVEKNDMAPKTKPAPTKATDDTDAKVTILLSALTDLEKEFHRDGEDNSVLRGSLYDGYPKVKEPFDLVRLSNYDLEEVKWRYRNILTARADVPVKTTLDEVDKSIEALPPTVANDLPKRDLAASVSPDEPLPDADAGLNVWFARTTETVKASEQKPEHWSKTDSIRSVFWGEVKTWFNKYDASRPMDGKAREEYTRKALGVEHIDQTPLSKDEAVAKVRAAIDAEFAPKQAAEVKPQNAPISNEKASNLNDAPKSEVKTNVPKIDANLTANSNGASEEKLDKASFRKKRTIKVSGREYLKAGDRVVMFRSDHPDWTLETISVQLTPTFACFKCSISDEKGRLRATGHGFCSPEMAKNVSGRFVEKAETAAIARALSFVGGYGTDDSLDDSDYLADSPVEKTA